MPTIKEEFLAIIEKQFIKNLTMNLYENFQIDGQAMEEMEILMKKECFIEELFTNTHKVVFSNETLDKLMQSTVESQRVKEECLLEANITEADFEKLVSNTQSRFFEGINDQTSKNYSRFLQTTRLYSGVVYAISSNFTGNT